MARTAAQEQAQANRNTIFVEDGEIMSVETFAGDQFIQRIRAPKCAAAARPGTYVHLTCDESLPMSRQMTIMRVGNDRIEVLYKIEGQGLRLNARKKAADRIS